MIAHRPLLAGLIVALAAAPILWWFDRPPAPGLTFDPEIWTADPPLVAGTQTVARFKAANSAGRPVFVLSWSTC